jgi:hypothetical protein
MGKPNGCKDCFYALKDASEFPCVTCNRFSHYIHKDVYKEETDNKAWAKVVEGLNGIAPGDFKEVKGDPHFWPKFELKQEHYDSVSKPKHYMLFDFDDVIAFEGRGIEVRDVIAKLVRKVATQMGEGKIDYSPMFESDYVQMMQYLMRFMDKNGVEDLKKARWYLDKLIEAY